MRLIDMDTLWQCETCFHHKPNGCDTWCDAGEAYRPAASKLKAIDPSTLRPKGEWISVEDRLPEQYTSVIVWDGQYVGEAMWEGDIFEWASDENIAFATHWMPLPEPPNTEVVHDS